MHDRHPDRSKPFPSSGSDDASDQSEVIRLLNDPLSYAPAAASVQRIETHGALVFLAGDRAYKLKRAVKLPYMDFSTLPRRAKACHHEIERNQAAAPDIYIGARPIVRRPSGRLEIADVADDDGETIDWLVVMNRFDQSGLLDNLAGQEQLPADVMAPLAEVIADYHASARAISTLDGGHIFARCVTQTIIALQDAGDALDPDEVHKYAERIATDLTVHSALLRHRAQNGLVRLCHGDLHLRNIVLLNGKPTLFDAIEFDDAIARIDVLYDLAFLLMDLWHRGLKRHANLCLNTYASKAVATDELSGLAALPMFLATRAAIRALVAIDRAALSSAGGSAQERDEIAAYFALAQEVLELQPPVLVAIGGFSGTGKSTLAAALAPTIGQVPGALHLRSDVERKRMVGIDPLDRLPQHAYSPSTAAKVYKHLYDRAREALRAGHSVIVDATFIDPAHRHEIEQVAKDAEVCFVGIWLEAAPERLVERVNRRRNDASDADESVVRAQLSSHAACTNWTTIDTGGDFEAVLASAMAVLEPHAGP